MGGEESHFTGLEDCGQWLAWDFVGRQPGIAVDAEREEAVRKLVPTYAEAVGRLGGEFSTLSTAEQVHGDRIAVVDGSVAGVEGAMPNIAAGADGLVTGRQGRLLGILVADCCAVAVVDPARRVIGLLHSGKKGTEAGIVPKAIALMAERYGSVARELRVSLSPCIRPPHYEVDFAAVIRAQCEEAGVPRGAIHDSGLCTGSDLRRFYSYRMERGRTGRMLALLGLRTAGA